MPHARPRWLLALLLTLSPCLSTAGARATAAGAATAVTDSLELANVVALGKAGQYVAAESLARAVVARSEGAHDSLGLMRALSVFGNALLDRWKLGEARLALERALRVEASLPQPDPRDALITRIRLTTALRLAARLDTARVVGQEALRLSERWPGAESPEYASALRCLALVEMDRAEVDTAVALLIRSVDVLDRTQSADSLVLADALHSLGMAQRRAGDWPSARESYEREISIRGLRQAADHPDMAWAFNNLANVLFDVGDLPECARLHLKALAIRERRLGPDDPATAFSLINLGNVYEAMGEPARALPFVTRGLAIRQQALAPDHPDIAQAQNNLALVLAGLGQFASAESLYERSLALRIRALGEWHPEVVRTSGRLAGIREVRGDIVGAESLYVHGVQSRERTYGADHPETALSRAQLANALLRQGRLAEALKHGLDAEHQSVRHFRQLARALSERDALGYLQWRLRGLDAAVYAASLVGDAVTDAADQAWDALIHSRAIVLDEMADRRHALAGSENAAADAALDSLAIRRSQLAALVLDRSRRERTASTLGALESASRAVEEAERTAAAQSLRFRTAVARGRAGLVEIRAALPADVALVAFVLCDSLPPPGTNRPTGSRYFAFVLASREGRVELLRLGEQAQVDRSIARWLAQVSSPPSPLDRARRETAAQRVGTGLRMAVWDPVERALRGATRVLIVPDGSLSLVNFAALPAARGGYLVEHGPIMSLLAAERDLVTLARRRGGEGLLAIGAPAFDRAPIASPAPASGQRSLRGASAPCGGRPPHFDPLPGAHREIQELAALWRDRAAGSTLGVASVREGVAATKGAFVHLAPGKRALHVATHAFVLSPPCQEDRRAGLTRGVSMELVHENPLLRCGLALAGASDRSPGADHAAGLMTAAEVASLDLESVEWAVLSACETGGGTPEAGEGVLGLRRAFQVAGVATLVMSLWPVDDAGTRDWMLAFYRAKLERGEGCADAAWAASRALLRQRRAQGHSGHPFGWAAFVSVGEWR